MIRGGENISCAEVENAIYEFDAVSEAAVFSLPDERLGEVVGAAVVPKAGQSISAAALSAFLVDKLASFKQPAHVFVWEGQLPKGDTGKILKRRIKEEAAQKMQQSLKSRL